MTQTETDEESMRNGLENVIHLVEMASHSVAKLMASVRHSPHLMVSIANRKTGLGTQIPS